MPMQTDATLLANNTQHCWAYNMLRPFAWALKITEIIIAEL